MDDHYEPITAYVVTWEHAALGPQEMIFLSEEKAKQRRLELNWNGWANSVKLKNIIIYK